MTSDTSLDSTYYFVHNNAFYPFCRQFGLLALPPSAIVSIIS
jgi:hypothetical protein